MKRTIRLTEADLHNVIRNSVKCVLREMEEYDWDYPESDLPSIKKLENNASWKNKEIGDDNARRFTQIWDVQGYPNTKRASELVDDTYYDYGYDNGYDKMYGNRDVNDEYFTDSDYEFKHDGWDEDSSNLMDRHEQFRGGYI